MHTIWYHPHFWVLCIGISEEIFVWKIVTKEHWIWMLNSVCCWHTYERTERSIYPMAMISNRNRNECAEYTENRMCYKSQDLLCAASQFNPLLNSTFFIRQLINSSKAHSHIIDIRQHKMAQSCQLQTFLPFTLSPRCRMPELFWMLECLYLDFRYCCVIAAKKKKTHQQHHINDNKYYQNIIIKEEDRINKWKSVLSIERCEKYTEKCFHPMLMHKDAHIHDNKPIHSHILNRMSGKLEFKLK